MNAERYHPAARVELAEAAAWYETQRSGLGLEFLAEVRAAQERIAANPLRWPRVTSRSRAYRRKRIPYRLVYQVQSDGLVVVAVMHVKRKPGYWRGRL